MLPDSSSEEDDLVDRAIKRDKEAFAKLYDRYIDLVFRHIRYRIEDAKEAEDLAQEVFIKAWMAINKYKRTEVPVKAWLMTIARNLVYDYYKSKKKTTSLDEAEDIAEPESDNAIEKIEQADSEERLKRSIQKLGGDKQKVIMMRYIDGFSLQEIAKTLNKSEGAVRVIQFRALHDLKDILEQKNR
jgi:RNA polymerase sigma-70 factor (ECF subfamily)